MKTRERQRGEARYGGVRHGSGKFMTPQIWRRLPLGSFRGDWDGIAIRAAWPNGCGKPGENIQKNGPKENAKGDSRNNFLYGLIKDRARRSNRGLFNTLVYGWESIGDAPYEQKHVPASYRKSGIRRGLACDAQYEITSLFWKTYDSFGVQSQNFRLRLLSALESAVDNSVSVQDLKREFRKKAVRLQRESMKIRE